MYILCVTLQVARYF